MGEFDDTYTKLEKIINPTQDYNPLMDSLTQSIIFNVYERIKCLDKIIKT
jgi:hypothetical protein